MVINDFKLESFFSKYEFNAPYLLTQSDCESMSVEELLALEDGAEEKLRKLWLGYTETWGDPELRCLISSLYETIKDEEVLITHGAQEAIFLCMNILLNPGDHVIVLYPNYQSLYEIINTVPGCTYSRWELHDGGDRWFADLDELEALFRTNTRLVVISSPNNPTGFAFSNKEAVRLSELCWRHGCNLLSDEVYHGLNLDGEARQWFTDLYDKALSIGVLSKSYGLPGLRVGWIAGKDLGVLKKIEKFKHYTSICDSAPSEFLAKIALRHSDVLIDRSIEIIRKNMNCAHLFFKKYEFLFQEKMYFNGPITFHRFWGAEGIDEFCRKVMEHKGILLAPSSVFEAQGEYFRMGYGRRSFPLAIEKLEELMNVNNYGY